MFLRRLVKLVTFEGLYIISAIKVNVGIDVVSRSQTLVFAQGRYRLQYKRPARKGSGISHSTYSFWDQRKPLDVDCFHVILCASTLFFAWVAFCWSIDCTRIKHSR